MPTKLVGLKINTLGSVDKAANGHALVSLMKRHEGATSVDINISKALTEAVSKADTMTAVDLNTILLNRALDDVLWDLTRALDTSIESIIKDPSIVDNEAAISVVMAQFYSALVNSGITKIGMVTLGKKVNEKASTNAKPILKRLLEEADIYIGKKQKQGGMNMPMTEEEKKAAAAAMAAKVDAEVAKRMSEVESIQKRNIELETLLAKADTDRIAAESILKAEREEVSKREFIAKAGEFKNLPVKAEEFGIILKGLSEKAPEEYAQIDALLKAADAAISKGGIFTEVGTGSEGANVTALDQLNALADGMVAKGENGLSRAQAFAKALDENPKLYAQYEIEQNVRGSE